MRIRLRPAYPPAELAALYKAPHDHTRWPDHVARVEATIALAKGCWPGRERWRIADLSCGDAAIAYGLVFRPAALRTYVPTRLILGDLAPGYAITGPIEDTLGKLTGDPVDLFVCCETIEHLDDPDTVLRGIRERSRRLLLSTPLGEHDDANPEHYWGWDEDDVHLMLDRAGWEPIMYLPVEHAAARYQVWCCE